MPVVFIKSLEETANNLEGCISAFKCLLCSPSILQKSKLGIMVYTRDSNKWTYSTRKGSLYSQKNWGVNIHLFEFKMMCLSMHPFLFPSLTHFSITDHLQFPNMSNKTMWLKK